MYVHVTPSMGTSNRLGNTVSQECPVYQLLPAVDGGQMRPQRNAHDSTPVPLRFILNEVKALFPVSNAIVQAAGKDVRGAGRAFLNWKGAEHVLVTQPGGFSPGEEKTLGVGTSILSHLPASAMMVRSNAATTTVTPMGTF